jgi:hypothetical protein
MTDNHSAMTRTLLISCAVSCVLSQQVDADCKVPPPPCDALAEAQVVFYGEVEEVTSKPYFVGASVALLSVRFNVLRAFKGVKEGPLSETFYYGADDVRFEAKRRYLVYAIRRPGTFLIVGCTRTGYLAATTDPIRFAEMIYLDMCPKTK